MDPGNTGDEMAQKFRNLQFQGFDYSFGHDNTGSTKSTQSAAVVSQPGTRRNSRLTLAARPKPSRPFILRHEFGDILANAIRAYLQSTLLSV